ncbi:TPA: hypothetical protein ACXNQV_003112 [Stenotrophomonas maltophilia]
MRRIARHLRSYLLMLLMAAFVVVPVADALACAVEPHASVARVESAADDTAGDSDSKHTGACTHNHCHHSTSSLPANTFAAFDAPLPARWMTAGDATAYAVAQDELTRPPRA